MKMKNLGFNMLRKHIKIESLRWYYHCDRFGILVWQGAVSGGVPYSTLIFWQFIGFDKIKDNITTTCSVALNTSGIFVEWLDICIIVRTFRHEFPSTKRGANLTAKKQ